nr:hypothetical protein [Escherichia coli]
MPSREAPEKSYFSGINAVWLFNINSGDIFLKKYLSSTY